MKITSRHLRPYIIDRRPVLKILSRLRSVSVCAGLAPSTFNFSLTGQAPATFPKLLCSKSFANLKTPVGAPSPRSKRAHETRPVASALGQPNLSSRSPNSSLQPPRCSAASNLVNFSPSSSTSLWSSQQHLCYGRVSPSPRILRHPSSSFFLVAWSPHFKEETCYFYGIEGRIRRLER